LDISNTADCTANRNGLNHAAVAVVLCQLALHLLHLLLLAGVGGTKRWQGTQLGVHGTLTAMCNSCSCSSSVLSAADKQWLWAVRQHQPYSFCFEVQQQQQQQQMQQLSRKIYGGSWGHVCCAGRCHAVMCCVT
jgi:hypothetical protein